MVDGDRRGALRVDSGLGSARLLPHRDQPGVDQRRICGEPARRRLVVEAMPSHGAGVSRRCSRGHNRRRESQGDRGSGAADGLPCRHQPRIIPQRSCDHGGGGARAPGPCAVDRHQEHDDLLGLRRVARRRCHPRRIEPGESRGPLAVGRPRQHPHRRRDSAPRRIHPGDGVGVQSVRRMRLAPAPLSITSWAPPRWGFVPGSGAATAARWGR